MQKAHSNTNWEEYPSDKTPLNKRNLDKMDNSIDIIDDRVIVLDTTKFDKSDAQLLVKTIDYNQSNGVFTINYYNGTAATIDTLLEKLAVNFDYDYDTQQLIIELSDGEKKYVDLSALITQYEFLDSETIAFVLNSDGKVTAKVKEGSIQEKHLQPNYLADIKIEAAKAEKSASDALTSENNAKTSETNAEQSALTATDKATDADMSAKNAKESETNAKASEENAKTSETNAGVSEQNAKESETNAGTKADEANTSATNAKSSEENAKQSAASAESSAVKAQQAEADLDSAVQLAKDYANEASTSVSGMNDIITQLNNKLQFAEFGLDDNGNLVYTEVGGYDFSVDDNGYLNYEVA
jgi:hypothetical protein